MVERNKDFTCKYITQYSRNLNPQPQCRKAWGLTSCTNEQREKEKGFQMLYNKLRTECWKMTNETSMESARTSRNNAVRKCISDKAFKYYEQFQNLMMCINDMYQIWCSSKDIAINDKFQNVIRFGKDPQFEMSMTHTKFHIDGLNIG